MSKEVWCDTGSRHHPRHLIAVDPFHHDAESLAEGHGARHDGGDTGSGDWFCAEYVDAQYAEGRTAAAAYGRELQERQDMQAREDWQDAILSRADDIYKGVKENGR